MDRNPNETGARPWIQGLAFQIQDQRNGDGHGCFHGLIDEESAITGDILLVVCSETWRERYGE